MQRLLLSVLLLLAAGALHGQMMPLPLTLTSFAVKAAPSGATLSWQTADETNTAYFIVERSLDGTKFAPVAWLPAAGFSAQTRKYGYHDDLRLLDAGRVFYQLRFVDRDSLYRFSRVEALSFENRAPAEPRLYPNPTQGAIQLLLPQEWGSGPLHLTVTDAAGRLLHRETRPQAAHGPLNLAGLPAGIYWIQLQSGAKKKNFPLVKL